MSTEREVATSFGVGDVFIAEYWDDEAGDYGMIADKSYRYLRDDLGREVYGDDGQRVSRPLTVHEYIEIKKRVKSGDIETPALGSGDETSE